MKYSAFLTALMAAGLMTASGEERPKAYLVSDAHLDTQWNWDVQTTIREFIPKTIRQNLLLLREYPDYVFNFEGGVKYAWMKEYYPHEYELVKEYIKNGRWHISGASWDACDVIVPSVESQIRNIMLGQNLYRDEFGVESTDIFLPDCFGFGRTLPSIASHCGLIGFSSQKLDWRTNPFYGDRKLPFTIGLWQGVDGSRIMMAHGYGYGHRWHGEDLSEDPSLNELAGRSPLNTVYRYYGTGDTGGSPTIGSVSAVERGIAGNGPVEIISATSDRLYKDYLPYGNHPELPVFDGELLIDVHSTGCYTSQAAMKLYNRQNEQLGDAAERAAVLASLYSGSGYPAKSFTELWRRFIWHQFHDDLTGTSIPRAYEFSWNDELLTLKQFSHLLTRSVAEVAAGLDTRAKGEAVVLYNPLAYEVTDLVEISVPASSLPAKADVTDHAGRKMKAQVIGYADGEARVLVEAVLPPVSMAVYDVRLSGKRPQLPGEREVRNISNSVYDVEFDSDGDIISLKDKRSGRELVKAGSKIRLALFTENESTAWPAWEIQKTTLDREPVSIPSSSGVVLVEDGPLRKTVKVSKRHGDSGFVQYISLYEGDNAARIDFANEIDWATTNALLKAEFPLAIANGKATYDLGLGVAERGNNVASAYEVPAREWANLSDRNGGYNVTIANDSKYGWDKPDDNTLRMTLLHTPKTSNSYAYQDHQDFGRHEFTYSLIGAPGELNRVMSAKSAERLNQRVKAFRVDKHKGEGRCRSFVRTDRENVVVKALKGAEDGKGYIVRVYETSGQPAEANIIFDKEIVGAAVADGTEKPLRNLEVNGRSLPVSLVANGMATFRVDFAPSAPAVGLKTAPVPLVYDKKGMTWNEFRHNGEFSQGYTYAAELMPESITYDGVPFNLSPRLEKNVMSAKGDTLVLPQGDWERIHFLVSAAKESGFTDARFNIGGREVAEIIPSYTGFVGQWGHDGHTSGYLNPGEVAYVGTHRHSSMDDEPYEYTYLYHIDMEIPKGVGEIVLPDNPEVAVFSATVSRGAASDAVAASRLFKTANRPAEELYGSRRNRTNLLTADMITGCSSFVNDRERPEFLLDGDLTTKWCDVAGVPSTVDFDMKEPRKISGWKLVNAAEESPGYVTSVCYLLGRNTPDEDWQAIDCLRGNRANVVERDVTDSAPFRYLRLMVTSPTQDPSIAETRIYELEVYE